MKNITYYCDYGAAPRKDDFVTYHVYSAGKVLFSGNNAEFEAFKARGGMKGNPMVEKTVDETALIAARNAHARHVGELLAEFKADLLADNGVSGPKADKAYSLAWEYGHSSGLSEVVNYFEDLVELIKD